MIKSAIVGTVAFCTRRPWWIVALALALTVGSAFYASRHFAIRTDVRDLISPDLPWSQRAAQFLNDFPQREIIVVVDAPTAELVEQATTKLAGALRQHSDRFIEVSQPGSGSFFERNGLLFLPRDEVARVTAGLSRADDLLGTLAGDPSLRGALDTLSLALLGVDRGEIKLDDLVLPMSMAADTIEAVLAGRPASFSWRALAAGKPPAPEDLRRFIQVRPVLDFNVLQPGRAATEAISAIASELKLDSDFQAHVRLTGQIPMDDDEFGTITQNVALTITLSLLLVLGILWLALRSPRIILAVMSSLAFGLAVSAAAGLFLVGAFNLISIAFFALFVGLGVDFAIQFSVRYRAERHDHPDLDTALRSAAEKAGGPLAFAAVAIAVGFVSFMPTDYRGLSELGEIAGLGMIVAFIASVTLLPALLALLAPPGEPYPMGFAALAAVDRFTARHRIPIVAITILVVVIASPLLLLLPFDFNPLHLQNPRVESVATYLELKSDPQAGANAIELEAPDLKSADATARRIDALAQVSRTMTLSNFIPGDRDEKIKLIREAADKIGPSMNPEKVEPPPTDQDNIEDLSSTADGLLKSAENKEGRGADAARRLAGLLSRLAEADAPARTRVQVAIAEPLRTSLDQLRQQLEPQQITVDTIPRDVAADWVAPDGRHRIQVLPSGDPENTDTLRSFVTAVLAIDPNATGPAVVLFEAGKTVVHAFIVSGIFALSAITLLLLVALRRIGDVLLTLVPLLIAGVVTLELCVVFDLPLNFANIIALPLLLGVGVAFKIYYIMAWRAGKTGLLQSSLTRAVVFSAMTTATAFGSLWLSDHPGTSSMGKLMALALICTMAAAVFFQPVLMGPPRSAKLPHGRDSAVRGDESA
jgi:hopanoid biosynthesis associated RND transporter like protein HpnN